jgi:hypothetical protein
MVAQRRLRWGEHHQVQLVTVGELLSVSGKRIDMPPLRQTSVTFRRAPKAKVEIVSRLRSIWDPTAGTEDAAGAEDADVVEDLEDAEE